MQPYSVFPALVLPSVFRSPEHLLILALGYVGSVTLSPQAAWAKPENVAHVLIFWLKRPANAREQFEKDTRNAAEPLLKRFIVSTPSWTNE